MEKLNVIAIKDIGEYSLFLLPESSTYFILKPIYKNVNLPKNIKSLKKPNFSYYPSIKSISNGIEGDEKLSGFPSQTMNIDVEGHEDCDAEVLILQPKMEKYFVDLVFKTISNIDDLSQTIFDTVVNLETIFGLVFKIKKKIQIGLIGELLILKNSGEYLKEFLEGYHIEEYNNFKKFESKTDFEINTHNNKKINIEVKTTTSDEDLFSLKNHQINENINDYFAAIKISEVRKGGKTLIDLIDWYLSIPSLALGMKEFFTDFKENHDKRNLIRFSEEEIKIKFINIKEIPYIKEYDNKIKNISFNIDLFNIKSYDLNSIMQIY
ncbi:hypothetical protein [Spiroplasma floricola]|uniref:PD-(D/E)XK motif protein n=1 Tax=Spiroplasma floricola 23-6 TaxID=1336749 RepID=A0A2K8SE42_9MOLU|nr:hypothetical protein [Spiroplasma floricola]AUB31737.1 hypothetical protein SFLOR_v1c06890 [Spiroplasma floricola 23-6]